MQVFVPYQSPLNCAKAMWPDQKRFHKQIVECEQIIKAIDRKTKAWINHPCTKMYEEHRSWLCYYLNCLKCYRGHIKTGSHFYLKLSVRWSKKADSIRPPFLTEEFCNQHKRMLFTKAPDLYPQFAEYGTSEVNWYCVDGEILKYRDGKRIKETD